MDPRDLAQSAWAIHDARRLGCFPWERLKMEERAPWIECATCYLESPWERTLNESDMDRATREAFERTEAGCWP